LISNSLLVAEGSPEELLNNKLAKKLYFGSELKI
jgi:ABC-type lipopolysaccharide export system ATPase subunit